MKNKVPSVASKPTKKSAIEATKPGKSNKPGLAKDAGNFLKHRMGSKLKNLRENDGQVDLRASLMEAMRRGDDLGFHASCSSEAPPINSEESFFADQGGNVNREAENTRKRFFKELRKVLAAADVIVQVLDARDPASCRSEAVEQEVAAAGKRLILLINKIDLVPKNAVEAWMQFFQRAGFPTIPFKAARGGATRPMYAMTSAARAPDGLLQSTHAVVGADDLMQLLKNYARLGGTQTKAHVSVGIVGYPNTGKSSVINSMKRQCCVETGGRAGVTKEMQEVKLDSKVTLIDSPGVVFEGATEDPSVVLRNVVRVENVSNPEKVVEALLKKAPRDAVMSFYGLERDFETTEKFLTHVAQDRGKLRRGGGLDLHKAAQAVIADWTTGKFRYFVMPPQVAQETAQAVAAAQVETAEIVHTLAPCMDIDALFSGQGEKPAVLGAPAESDDVMDISMGPMDVVQVDMAAMGRAR